MCLVFMSLSHIAERKATIDGRMAVADGLLAMLLRRGVISLRNRLYGLLVGVGRACLSRPRPDLACVVEEGLECARLGFHRRHLGVQGVICSKELLIPILTMFWCLVGIKPKGPIGVLGRPMVKGGGSIPIAHPRRLVWIHG